MIYFLNEYKSPVEKYACASQLPLYAGVPLSDFLGGQPDDPSFAISCM